MANSDFRRENVFLNCGLQINNQTLFSGGEGLFGKMHQPAPEILHTFLSKLTYFSKSTISIKIHHFRFKIRFFALHFTQCPYLISKGSNNRIKIVAATSDTK